MLIVLAVDDASGDDGGGRPADPRETFRAARSARTSSSAMRRSASIRATRRSRSRTRRSSSPGSPRSACAAPALLYAQIVDTVQPVSSPMVAETAKLHENTFRAVNIALANELALMCDRMGISPWEVIEAASSKPFGFLRTTQAPASAGDCIPVVPFPGLAVARVRLLGAPDRGGTRDQRGDASLRRPEDLRCAERFRPADQGLAAAAARDGVQGGRPRHARNRPRSRSCAN